MNNTFVLTGIGTDVGKTVTAAVLCSWMKCDYWKPIQSGELENSDTMKVTRLVNQVDFHCFQEKYRLNQPLSPHAAAKIDGVELDLSAIVPPSSKRPLLIEGAGGLMVPLNEKGELYIDLMAKWKLPVVLVSRHYLGSINHTLLSVEALKNRNIQIAGIVFVGKELPDTESLILRATGLHKILHIPEFETVDAATIAEFVHLLPTPTWM